jgi:Sodium:dicarboxylate symporter family
VNERLPYEKSPQASICWSKTVDRILYVQVLIAVFLGIVVGYLNPGLGKSLKPLGDGFINLVKMIIAPVIFCTVVHGIASMSDVKKLGRIAIKALVYFEVVSTLALVIGLVVINVLHPGAGFNIDVKALQADHLQQSQSEKTDSRYGQELTEIFRGFGADKDEEATATLEARLYRCPSSRQREEAFMTVERARQAAEEFVEVFGGLDGD